MNYKTFSFKKTLLLVTITSLLLVSVVYAYTNFFPSSEETIYQISTYDALAKGAFDGLTSLKSMDKFGNFGIGTFEGLNGEMVVLDGQMYQIKADGKAYKKGKHAMNSELTPYIVTTNFETDIKENLPQSENYQNLQDLISNKITNKDLFYAIRVEGRFSNIKVRSVPKQEKPYPTLNEALKNQSTYEYSNINGTLVGFWCPSYVGSVNVPGFHLHFISKDESLGGHVLEVSIDNAELNIDKTRAFNMILPDDN